MKILLSAFLILALAVFGLPTQGFTGAIHFKTALDGPREDPPNDSPGTGSATGILDTAGHFLQLHVTFQDLIGTTTASHIHAATALSFAGNAGVATMLPSFVGFPLGVTAGTMDQTFDLTLASSWNPTFINNSGGGTPAGAEAALAAAILSGRAYLNIHSTFRPGGEIRGFLVVPAPATMLLFGTGLACLAGIRLRRKKQ
jgi:hypothetical protein